MGAGQEPRQPVPSCQAWSNHGVQATAVTLRSTAAPDAQRSAYYRSLEGVGMRRRAFLTLLGGAAASVAWLPAARAAAGQGRAARVSAVWSRLYFR
jgi:hypothetical protein